jgi:hypothetical protein
MKVEASLKMWYNEYLTTQNPTKKGMLHEKNYITNMPEMQ